MFVFSLSLLGSNLFIAVITFGYNQVVTREYMCKFRLAEVAKEQDGLTCVTCTEGEVHKVSLGQLLKQQGFAIDTTGDGEADKKVDTTIAKGSDVNGDGNVDEIALDLTGDGHADTEITGGEDTTGDGQIDTIYIKSTSGDSEMRALSIVMDNPTAWPDVTMCGLSKICREMVLSSSFDTFIAVVILANGVLMAWHTYPMEADTAGLQTVLDYGFIVIYVFEVVAKMLGLGVMPYFAVLVSPL